MYPVLYSLAVLAYSPLISAVPDSPLLPLSIVPTLSTVESSISVDQDKSSWQPERVVTH